MRAETMRLENLRNMIERTYCKARSEYGPDGELFFKVKTGGGEIFFDCNRKWQWTVEAFTNSGLEVEFGNLEEWCRETAARINGEWYDENFKQGNIVMAAWGEWVWQNEDEPVEELDEWEELR